MKRLAAFASLALVALVLASGTFLVWEWEQVVITRFGEPIGSPITEPGLHWKLPIFDEVRRFDKRFLEWDGRVTQVPTSEKRFILVDTYARWRISDPLLYLQRLRDENGAQARLDSILDGETRDAIARHSVLELVRTSNREPLRDETQLEELSVLEPIVVGREEVRLEILESAQARTGELGIEILDVQFKRLSYVEEVRRSVYDRMNAERKRIADRFRSEGQGETSRINGERERELKQIESEAYRQAQEIVGRADAEAAEIYAQAYDQSPDARRFYAFLKTMETYGKTIDTDTWLLLSTKGELYGYLKDSQQ
ncbi:MAG: protease modulator HflC [Thermoanaerobaculia bacterium]|nr:protease modulator HflC [Thermoanaerobaculia bacterium]